MHVEVLYTDGCANARPVMKRLKELAHQRDDLSLGLRLVAPTRPAPETFAGSPTVLIDGVNPFGGVHSEGPSCALSPPTIAQIERAIGA